MLPFELSFRKLLGSLVPQLPKNDVDKHEMFVALWHQLKHEKTVLMQRQIILNASSPDTEEIKSLIDVLDSQIEEAARSANRVLEPFQEEFEAVQRVYHSRRRLALSQRKFFPIPYRNFKNFLSQIYNFRKLQFVSFWRFLFPRLEHAAKGSTGPKVALVMGLILVTTIGVQVFNENARIPANTEHIIENETISAETSIDPITGQSKTVIITRTTISAQVEINATQDSIKVPTPEKETVAGKPND